MHLADSNKNPVPFTSRFDDNVKQATITLLKEADNSVKLSPLRPTDVTEILNTILCTQNYSEAENNRGCINELVPDICTDKLSLG